METDHKSQTTTNHDQIKNWVEEREGKPSVVESTTKDGKSGGLLRINFPGGAEENLKDIGWEEFFDIFDKNDLKFLYQEKNKDGDQSRFCKFIADEE